MNIAPELRRAFAENKADYIIVDGWTPQRLALIAQEAEASKLLTVESRRGDQYTALVYRPTAKLRDLLGLRGKDDQGER